MSGNSAPASDGVSLDGFNPFSEAVQQCPHLYYRAMQEQAPVFAVQGTDLFMVTKHEIWASGYQVKLLDAHQSDLQMF
jgi:hypothetical protein